MANKIFGIFLVVTFCALTLSGCDQVSSKYSHLVGGKTPVESLDSVQKKFNNSEFLDAIKEAETFVKNPGPQQGAFSLIVAKAEAALGQIDSAIYHLGIALTAGAVDPLKIMFDPAFETMRTDVRFLALITASSMSTDAGNANSTAQPAAPVEPLTPGIARVQIDSSGIEAKAGDVVVKLAR